MTEKRRCAIYTRKSTAEGLEQDFNSLHAQREACEAFIKSHRQEGWRLIRQAFNDGGYSGATMDRPALTHLLDAVRAGKVDVVVVYKVDRLTRSLVDFAKIIELFDAGGVSFAVVTQQFNTTTSMGRLTLNVLLSFAQFEREVTGERIRDKIAASKKKGIWMGGLPPLGYDVCDKKLVVNPTEAAVIRLLFGLYLERGSVRRLQEEADRRNLVTKRRTSGGRQIGGKPFSRGHLYQLLHNPIYIGVIAHKDDTYPGQHEAIVDPDIWQAVQAELKANAAERHVATNRKPAHLLTGLIYDAVGDRLCPTHATKKGRRYRYYISKRLVHSAPKPKDGWRIPGEELERAVMRKICEFLEDGPLVIEAVDPAEKEPSTLQQILHAASDMAKRLMAEQSTGQSAQDTACLRKLIHRVEVDSSCIRIAMSRRGLCTLVGIGDRCAEGQGVLIPIELPVAFRRRGVEGKIILAAADGGDAPDHNLITLVARSYHWFDRITKGELTSIRMIADEASMDVGDVSRFLPLAFLAPDIVESILIGKQPTELTAEKLKRLPVLPHCWKTQRKSLGFPV